MRDIESLTSEVKADLEREAEEVAKREIRDLLVSISSAQRVIREKESVIADCKERLTKVEIVSVTDES